MEDRACRGYGVSGALAMLRLVKFIGQLEGAVANAWEAGDHAELGSCFTKDSIGNREVRMSLKEGRVS